MSIAAKKKVGLIILTVVLVIVGIAFIYPFLFMLSSSFKPSAEVTRPPFSLIPETFTFDNYVNLGKVQYFGTWYLNTIVMCILTLVLKTFITTLTAFAFAKINFKGRDAIFLVLMSALMIPSDIMLIPRYFVFSTIGILDTMFSIVLPYGFDIYFVFLLRQNFVTIPDAIVEAAEIDGCSYFKIYYSIVVPLAKPAIVTMLLFTFVWAWNDYMSAYIFISSDARQMISVGLERLSLGRVTDNGLNMAGATVTVLPIIVVFLFSQKYFIEGITSSGVKG